MPSIDGGDSLSPSYAPWAYIGPKNEHFVWQTSEDAEHEGYLYRAGMTGYDQVVCERRPLEDAPLGTLMNRERVEEVPVELIPDGLFPSLSSMADRLGDVKAAVDKIDPSMASSDQLGAQIRDKQQQ